jgi:hypothetical protein
MIVTIMFIQKWWSSVRYFDWWSSVRYFDWWSSARYFDYNIYTEMMKFCQVFSLSWKYLAELHHFCINMIVKIPDRTSSVKIPGRASSVKIPGRTSSFLYKHEWWSSARYFDYDVYTEMMKFCQVFWLMKLCQVFWLSCLYRNDEVNFIISV